MKIALFCRYSEKHVPSAESKSASSVFFLFLEKEKQEVIDNSSVHQIVELNHKSKAVVCVRLLKNISYFLSRKHEAS